MNTMFSVQIFSKGLEPSRSRLQAQRSTAFKAACDGLPLLLLHGIPETHVLWRKVAPALAKDYFVVMTDLRGYGYSSKPAGGGDHFAYSKRAMAQDQIEVMRHLGFENSPSWGTTGAGVQHTVWLSIIPKR